MPYAKHQRTPSSRFWQSQWQGKNPEDCASRISMGSNRIRTLIDSHIPANSRVLDGGCGLGQWSIYLKEEGCDVVGLDSDKHTIGRLLRSRPDIDWRVGSVLQLPFRDGEFDAYISMGVLEHLENRFIDGIKEANRILRSDGIFVLSVPFFSPFRKLLRSYHVKRNDLPFYQYYFELEEITTMLPKCGFEVINATSMDSIWGIIGEMPYVSDFYGRLQHALSRTESDEDSNSSRKSAGRRYLLLKKIHDTINDSNLLCATFGHMIFFAAMKRK